MGIVNQNAFNNFHKMAKNSNEKDFKTVMDKHWLLFHAEIARLNPEFKKTKKADFFTITKIARGCSPDEFIKFVNGDLEVPPVKLRPDELKSLRAAMELFRQVIPVMDAQFSVDWFFKQKDAPAPAPAAAVPEKKAA